MPTWSAQPYNTRFGVPSQFGFSVSGGADYWNRACECASMSKAQRPDRRMMAKQATSEASRKTASPSRTSDLSD